MNGRISGFDAMRFIGKAWATAARAVRPVGYIKEGRTNPVGPIHPCRGATRAARRRAERAAMKAAGRAA